MRRWRALLDLPRPSSFNDSRMRQLVACSAGASPKTRPVTTDSAEGEPRRPAIRRRWSSRAAARRCAAGQERNGPRGDEQPGCAAEHSQHETLDNQLADDARAAGAERDPHRHLFLPIDGAGEQQVRDIGAGDEEHERHGAGQHQQCRSNVLRPADPAPW